MVAPAGSACLGFSAASVLFNFAWEFCYGFSHFALLPTPSNRGTRSPPRSGSPFPKLLSICLDPDARAAPPGLYQVLTGSPHASQAQEHGRGGGRREALAAVLLLAGGGGGDDDDEVSAIHQFRPLLPPSRL